MESLDIIQVEHLEETSMSVRIVSMGIAALLVAAFLVPGVGATGNGAMSGPHFNLNLIGVEKTDILPGDQNSGARIFVKLFGNSKIYLTQGDTFDVLDADATDGRGEFMLPAPDMTFSPEGDWVSGNYRVFVRELGKPGGSAKLSTCGEVVEEGVVTETICSLDNVTLIREKGRSVFQDVTRKLTTVYYYDTVLMKYVRVDLFDDAFENYLWSYDNMGLKHI
ncbi:MAG: hypothetical protein LUO96_01415, partial [Methanomicrobiales archaeon]|nr:hypothetical protein [Methanomicrobiales archaeon]